MSVENAVTGRPTSVTPGKLAHVVFRTQRLPEMKEFWSNLLQAEIAFENKYMCFLAFDEEHHRVALIRAPKLTLPPENAVGMDHVAFTYDRLDDLLTNFERLRGEGIRPHWTVNHGPTLSMYYRDPDGNQAEMQIDRFETMDEANEFFNSDVFAQNPIGITLDPDDLLARLRAGEPDESIIAYVAKP